MPLLQPLFNYLFKLQFEDRELTEDEASQLTEHCVVSFDVDYIEQTIEFVLRETVLLHVLKIITKTSFEKIIFKYLPSMNKELSSIEFSDVTIISVKSSFDYGGPSDALKYTFKGTYRMLQK